MDQTKRTDASCIRHDGARAALVQAIDDLTTSDGWQRWLECRARFHRYSLNNTLLIAAQRPTATQVAGYRAWQSMNRFVRKGEKGIAILAPMAKRIVDATTGEESFRVVGFKAVHVFDVAQTDGEPLPAPVQLLDGDSGGLFERLLAVAVGEGLSVNLESGDDGGPNGYLERDARRIVVIDRGSDAQHAKTLAHELAHWFDPGLDDDHAAYVAHRGEAETVAEAAAYVVGRAKGLDTVAYSAGYVATWTDADHVMTLAVRIDTAASAILSRLREAPAHVEAAA